MPNWLNGPPPEDHPRRCQSKSKITGNRCRRWALTGANQCQFHGGRTAQRHIVRISELPVFYSQKLRGSLAKAVEHALSQPVEEQLSLLEELALCRAMTSEVIVITEAAIDANAKAKDAAIMLAIELIKHVGELAHKAAQIDRITSDKISIHDLNAFLHQIVRIAYATIPEPQARKFERRLRDEVKVSTGLADNTSVIENLLEQVERAKEVVH